MCAVTHKRFEVDLPPVTDVVSYSFSRNELESFVMHRQIDCVTHTLKTSTVAVGKPNIHKLGNDMNCHNVTLFLINIGVGQDAPRDLLIDAATDVIARK
mmetsp:Transcript_331/g.728  ORF Transcript_331/g.728 Transcript_331/m.728 type:complete len:99 (-) Transcript_331:74-370(-)